MHPRTRYALAAAAATTLVACAPSPQGLVPSGAANATAPTRWKAMMPGHGGSWMARGLAQRDLLYVSNNNGTVNVYRYWQRTLVGVLTNFQRPLGECSDWSGNVYITDYNAKKIYVYAHGGTKAVRAIDDSPYRPKGCAVSPKGDLAVANYGTEYSSYFGDGNIAVWTHATGTPAYYADNNDNHFTSCAYDNHGDLLATTLSGYSGIWYYSTEFYYVPKGSSKAISMNLPNPYSSSGWDYSQVQAMGFDGKYWVVDSYGSLLRYTINIQATFVDLILLKGTDGVGAVALYRKTLKTPATQAAGDSNSYNSKHAVDFFKYPAGGDPSGTITKDLDAPSGLAISLRTK
jgi:hypothetical protein